MACRMFMIRKMKEMSEKKMAFKDDRDEIFGGREGGHAIVLVAKKEGVGDTGGVVEKEGFGTGIGSDSANESKDHHLHSRSLQHIHLSGNGHGKQREVDPAIKNYDDAWFTVGALDPTSGKLMLKGAQGGAATSSGGLELGLGFSGQSLTGDHKAGAASVKEKGVLDIKTTGAISSPVDFESFDAAAIHTVDARNLEGALGVNTEYMSIDGPHWRLLSEEELLIQASLVARDLTGLRKDSNIAYPDVPGTMSLLPHDKEILDIFAQPVAVLGSPSPSCSLIQWEAKSNPSNGLSCFQSQNASASASIGGSSDVNSYLLHRHFVPLSASQESPKPLVKKSTAKKMLLKKRKVSQYFIPFHCTPLDAQTGWENTGKSSHSGRKVKKKRQQGCYSQSQGWDAPTVKRQHTASLATARDVVFEETTRESDDRVLHQGSDGRHYYAAILAEEDDLQHLSPLQCELRKHLEVFEAEPEDVEGSKRPGRKGLVALGQVGIRCIYCARVHPGSRSTGSAYFSHTVHGVYQIAQNMTKLHLTEKCKYIPTKVKSRLKNLQSNGERSRSKNAKCHWHASLQKRGIYELQSNEDGKRLMRATSLQRV